MSTLINSMVGPRTVINGREMDFFAGTGYLGLQNHPQVIDAVVRTVQQYGFSTSVPRGGLGEHPVYDEFEQQACAFFGAEKISAFASGYLGPAYITQASGTLFDQVFIDSQAHFSLWDAAQGTNKPITVFHHLSPDDLEHKLDSVLDPFERPLVLTDGVFPISGEIAPLPGYLDPVRSRHGLLVVDDAHAAGVLGSNGRGTLDYFGLDAECIHACVTLSKAFGASGGLIYGSKRWVEGVEKDSRICAGSSTLTVAAASAASAALRLAVNHPEWRENLRNNICQLQNGLIDLGLPVNRQPVPVICIPAGVADIYRLRSELFEAGIAVELVRGYTSTPAGGALRIAVFATHTHDQIEKLLQTLKRLL